jgi:hypothetical protein
METNLEDRTWKEKLSALPSQVKMLSRTKIDTSKRALSRATTTVSQRIRSNPALYAGIAAGTGLALGLAGRMLRRRMSRDDDMVETFVIIEAC